MLDLIEILLIILSVSVFGLIVASHVITVKEEVKRQVIKEMKEFENHYHGIEEERAEGFYHSLNQVSDRIDGNKEVIEAIAEHLDVEINFVEGHYEAVKKDKN